MNNEFIEKLIKCYVGIDNPAFSDLSNGDFIAVRRSPTLYQYHRSYDLTFAVCTELDTTAVVYINRSDIVKWYFRPSGDHLGVPVEYKDAKYKRYAPTLEIIRSITDVDGVVIADNDNSLWKAERKALDTIWASRDGKTVEFNANAMMYILLPVVTKQRQTAINLDIDIIPKPDVPNVNGFTFSKKHMDNAIEKALLQSRGLAVILDFPDANPFEIDIAKVCGVVGSIRYGSERNQYVASTTVYPNNMAYNILSNPKVSMKEIKLAMNKVGSLDNKCSTEDLSIISFSLIVA